jgi:predicted dehydrogenase
VTGPGPLAEPVVPAPVGAERPVRVAIVGLGRVYDLNVLAFLDNPDVEVVALVDASEARRVQRAAAWPRAATFRSIEQLADADVAVDAVEVLLPITEHVRGVGELAARGWHVNLQKPMCLDLEEAAGMAAAARDAGISLRVMENYLFYEPLQHLKRLVDQGELGEVAGYHLKMVASGRGGWEVPWENYLAQFDLTAKGRGVLLFDDGWHKISTALWLFGPIREVRAWVGRTEVLPGMPVDAPSTVAWEHESGVRGVWDATLAVDLYLRSDYYTNDERWEVTGRGGFARVNRCTSRGLQQPSLEVYRDGELRQFHSLEDDWASSFAASGRHWIRHLRTGEGPLWWDVDGAIDVLRVALAITESSDRGGVGVDPASLR